MIPSFKIEPGSEFVLTACFQKAISFFQNLYGISGKRNPVQIGSAPGAVTGEGNTDAPKRRPLFLKNGKAGGGRFRKPEDVFGRPYKLS